MYTESLDLKSSIGDTHTKVYQIFKKLINSKEIKTKPRVRNTWNFIVAVSNPNRAGVSGTATPAPYHGNSRGPYQTHPEAHSPRVQRGPECQCQRLNHPTLQDRL